MTLDISQKDEKNRLALDRFSVLFDLYFSRSELENLKFSCRILCIGVLIDKIFAFCVNLVKNLAVYLVSLSSVLSFLRLGFVFV